MSFEHIGPAKMTPIQIRKGAIRTDNEVITINFFFSNRLKILKLLGR